MRRLIPGSGPTILALLISDLLLGCGGGEPPFLGDWRGEIRIRPDAEDARIDAALKLGGMELTLKADYTFTLKVLLLPIEGRWRLAGEDLVLVPEKIMGVSPEQYRTAMKPALDEPIDIAQIFDRERRLRWFAEDRTLRLVAGDSESLQIRLSRAAQELNGR